MIACGHRYIYTEAQLMDQMVMTLGGRAAESIVFGKVTTGASDDLKKVTQLAYAQVSLHQFLPQPLQSPGPENVVDAGAFGGLQVKQFGFSESIGAVSYKEQRGDQQFYRPHSDSVTDAIDVEVRKLVDDAYERVTQMLTDKRKEL